MRPVMGGAGAGDEIGRVVPVGGAPRGHRAAMVTAGVGDAELLRASSDRPRAARLAVPSLPHAAPSCYRISSENAAASVPYRPRSFAGSMWSLGESSTPLAAFTPLPALCFMACAFSLNPGG